MSPTLGSALGNLKKDGVIAIKDGAISIIPLANLPQKYLTLKKLCQRALVSENGGLWDYEVTPEELDILKSNARKKR